MSCDYILCDLCASMNVMPYSTFQALGIELVTPIQMRVKLTDRFKVENVLVKISNFIVLMDLIVLEMEGEKAHSLIFRHPFFITTKVVIAMEKSSLTYHVGPNEVTFHMYSTPSIT